MIRLSKIIPLFLLGVGVFTLMQVILPVVSYSLWEMSLKNSDRVLISPESSDTKVLGVSIENKNNFPAIISSLKRESKASYGEFNLSIPKIGLNASVLVDSDDFSQKLAHLPGSALPGEKGNMFITGHSAAGLWFAKSQEDYFAKLPQIKKGDILLVTAGGSTFKYQVSELKIVSPNDLSVIYPKEEGRFISLMTCVPPGINTKRLVVTGKMI